MATTVMLSESESALLEKARAEIFFRGIHNLSPAMLKFVRENIQENKIKLTKGQVIAISTLVLIYLLEKGERK